jgi:Xaa-Pro aminopeptidase
MHADGVAFPKRISLLRSRLSSLAVDALLLLDMKNVRYLTGFTGSDGVLVVSESTVCLMVDGRYTTQAKEEAAGVDIYEYRDKIDGVVDIVTDRNYMVVGFESAAMSVDVYERLRSRLAHAILRPLSEELSDLRSVKDGEEVELLRKAAAIAAAALEGCRHLIKPGVRERDFSLDLEFAMRRGGAQETSFPTIVASGEHSALPHATPGYRQFARGDMLVIDFGAVCDGYRSDETWTCVLTEATQRQRDIYEIVRQAHDRAVDAIRAGVRCAEIDRIARDCIEDRGLGAYFSHGTGHGVGLDVHEAPRLAAKSEQTLVEGMVVTVEPGVYIPGLWGVRLEDMVLVKEDSGEVLTKMSKEFTII